MGNKFTMNGVGSMILRFEPVNVIDSFAKARSELYKAILNEPYYTDGPYYMDSYRSNRANLISYK